MNPPSKYEVFKEVTERTTFKLGVGLPGRVMEKKLPEWIRDVYKDENFPRAKVSDQLGVHSAFACPIFTPQVLDVDEELLDMVERVATQVARVLEREKAEEVLRKQAQVLEQIHDAVISLDGKYKITGWNKGAERIFGFKEEEMIGKPFSYMFCCVESFVKEKLVKPALISGKFEKEMKVITKSGAIVYIHFSLSSLCDEDCIPVGLLCYALDITERKNFEISQREKDNELDKAHRRNQMILNAAGEGIYGIDSEGNTTFVNPSAARMLGYDIHELIGKHQHSIIHHTRVDHSSYAQEDCPIYASLKDGVTHTESDEVFWRKDGSCFPVEYVSTPIYEDERIFGAVVTFKDISEKKKVQLALEEYSQNLEKRVEQRTAELNVSVEKIKESRDQTEGILKSIGEGLIVTDLSGTVVLMNFAAEKILGINVGDALGKSAGQVIQNDVLLSQIMGAGESGKPFDFELGGKNGNQGRKYIQGISTSTHEAEESLVGSVTVLRDVTFERKVDNLKSQFLSTAAHELRTPLTTLQGFSEILLNKKNLPAESVDRYLKYINEESLRLGKIINDFLDISRIESGREIRLDKRSCVVSKIIDRSAQLFSEAHKASHEFVFQYLSKTDKWNVDLEKMEQIFKNLYSNAVKYSPDGGTITTSVRSVNGHTEVEIEDQGVGMSKDAVKKVFDKYYRGENMEKSVPGSGLGMTIVKYILEAHGGSVSVESEPGKGTKVVMCVPNK
ncbi:MAG: PAS domain S-box protein [Nitrospinae bacterium]|nr:PAS domain S-box protein [Nitrospinota bacterium]